MCEQLLAEPHSAARASTYSNFTTCLPRVVQRNLPPTPFLACCACIQRIQSVAQPRVYQDPEHVRAMSAALFAALS